MPILRKRDQGLIETQELANAGAIAAALDRMAEEILGRHADRGSLVLLGIRTGGVHLARRLHRVLADRSKVDVPMGVMDITLYRDDVFVGLARPEVGSTELPCSLEGRVVIVVDDVLFTGRTTRAALVELMDFGRPASIQMAALVDRGNRELPVHADYVGLTVKTTRDQHVKVLLRELGGTTDRVVLCERAPQ